MRGPITYLAPADINWRSKGPSAELLSALASHHGLRPAASSGADNWHFSERNHSEGAGSALCAVAVLGEVSHASAPSATNAIDWCGRVAALLSASAKEAARRAGAVVPFDVCLVGSDGSVRDAKSIHEAPSEVRSCVTVSLTAPAAATDLGRLEEIAAVDLLGLLTACRRYVAHCKGLPPHGNWGPTAFARSQPFAAEAIGLGEEAKGPSANCWFITDFAVAQPLLDNGRPAAAADTAGVTSHDTDSSGNDGSVHTEAERQRIVAALECIFGCARTMVHVSSSAVGRSAVRVVGPANEPVGTSALAALIADALSVGALQSQGSSPPFGDDAADEAAARSGDSSVIMKGLDETMAPRGEEVEAREDGCVSAEAHAAHSSSPSPARPALGDSNERGPTTSPRRAGSIAEVDLRDKAAVGAAKATVRSLDTADVRLRQDRLREVIVCDDDGARWIYRGLHTTTRPIVVGKGASDGGGGAGELPPSGPDGTTPAELLHPPSGAYVPIVGAYHERFYFLLNRFALERERPSSPLAEEDAALLGHVGPTGGVSMPSPPPHLAVDANNAPSAGAARGLTCAGPLCAEAAPAGHGYLAPSPQQLRADDARLITEHRRGGAATAKGPIGARGASIRSDAYRGIAGAAASLPAGAAEEREAFVGRELRGVHLSMVGAPPDGVRSGEYKMEPIIDSQAKVQTKACCGCF